MTDEQKQLIEHGSEVFVTACPGAGKTRTIVDRVAYLIPDIPPRKGVAVLSFTHSAVDTFIERCRQRNLETALRHPSFIGTFDAFIRHFFVLPGGIDGVNVLPLIIDSWDSLGVEVRLGGVSAFKGAGVSLDKFDPLNNHIDPSSIGHAGLRQHVSQNQQSYIRAATQYRAALRNKGYLSVADARVLATTNLENSGWATSLGQALKGRFYEIIVDEAQDCNPEDIKILQWLRSHGIRVTAVCDPDQAIYEFRYGTPTVLRDFSLTYDGQDQLPLTGNFRSSPAICSFTSTLRSRVAPDNSLGEFAAITHPIQIIVYRGAITSAIGQRFLQTVVSLEPDLEDRIILSHTAVHGLRASGNNLPNDSGSSRMARMAQIVSDFWNPSSSNRRRESALQEAEKIILGMIGKINGNEHPIRAAERHGIDKRELRRKALQFVSALPSICIDSQQGRDQWLNAVHQATRQLSLNFPPRQSEKTFFKNPNSGNWADCLLQDASLSCRCSTIHQAKGQEFKAVCVLVPPDRAPVNNTSNLFQAWENRVDDEAKRVIYVGATRAQKILSIAIPESFRTRLTNILDASNVPYALA